MADFQSISKDNKLAIVGELLEKNLKVEEKEVTIKGGGKEKTLTCREISKIDFKNPSLLVRVEDENGVNDIKIDTYPIAEFRLDADGKKVENSTFKSMLEVVNNITSKAENGEKGDTVSVSAYLGLNEYASAKDGKNYEFISFPQTYVQWGVSASNAEPMAEGTVTGIIKNIKREVKVTNDDEDETGRLEVMFYTFNYGGKVQPIKFIVDEDLADDFEDAFDEGDQTTLSYTIVKRHVGGKTKKAVAFGRASRVSTGFDVEEFVIIGGETAMDDDNAKYVSSKELKEAIAERKNYIDQKIEDKKEYDANNKGGANNVPSKSKGLGRKASVDDDFEDNDSDELPF